MQCSVQRSKSFLVGHRHVKTEWQQKRKEKHSNFISDGACKVSNLSLQSPCGGRVSFLCTLIKSREVSFYGDESSAAIHIFHDFHG